MSLSLASRLLLAPRKPIVIDRFGRVDDSTALRRADTGQAWASNRTIASQVSGGKAIRGAAGTDFEGSNVECNRADVVIEDDIIVVADVADESSFGVA